jgi:hypothetical protein
MRIVHSRQRLPSARDVAIQKVMDEVSAQSLREYVRRSPFHVTFLPSIARIGGPGIVFSSCSYVGSPRADERYATAALITYKLTREVWLKGEYRHEWRHSNVSGNDYQADVVLVGARPQR